MRCVTLAEALLNEGWTCALASRAGTAETVSNTLGQDIELVSVDGPGDAEADALAKHWPEGVDLLVVDHYGRGASFESACRPWAKRILVIDDFPDRPHHCDLLLDALPGRGTVDYAALVPRGCRLLLGAEYALLRPRFRELRPESLARRREERPVRRILVSFGATDAANTTPLALQAIAEAGLDAEIDVVLGPAAVNVDEVRSCAAALDVPARLHVPADDMAGLMARADITVGAAGTSSWERCCLGLPSILVVTGDNQRHVAGALASAGAAEVIGDRNEIATADVARALAALAADGAARTRMARRAGSLCDGLGATRVCTEIDPPRAGDDAPVRLRPARREDEDLLLAWRTDPRTCWFFRNPEAPGPEEHRRWLASRLEEPDGLFTIVRHGDDDSGVVRLDRRGEAGAYEVSILIAPEKYRLGIARAALSLARRLLPDAELWADVHAENRASLALFRSAGYVPAQGLLVNRPADREARSHG